MAALGNANRKADELVVFLLQRNDALGPETRMTTLTTAPLAPLLDRLFAEADAAEADMAPLLANVTQEEQARLMRS